MIDRRRVVQAIALMAAAGRVRAANSPPAGPAESLNAALLAFSQGRYWPLYAHLSATGGKDDPMFRELYPQLAAMIGDERSAIANTEAVHAAAPELTGAAALPAIAEIVNQARNRQVVIINEAHTISRTRAFIDSLLEALRPLGFDWMAAETFGPRVTDARGGTAVRPNFGFYVKDPVFAEAVRSALSLGYRLADYEARDDQNPTSSSEDKARSIAEREEAQARNLQAILARNPSARILVWCGHDHLQETAGTELGEPFAMRFKRNSGIDPLTIDQSQSWPRPDPRSDSGAVAAILHKYRPSEPIVVRLSNGAFATSGGPIADLTVFHPRLADLHGRPGWLAKAPGRRRATFKIPSGRVHGPSLIQCRHAHEADPTVPADQFLIGPATRQAVFYLRPGAYEVRLETANGYRPLGQLRV